MQGGASFRVYCFNFHAVLRERNWKNIVFRNHLGWTLTPRNPGFKLMLSLIQMEFSVRCNL